MRLLPAVAALAASLFVTACGSRETNVVSGNRSGTLHYAIDAEPRDLDPQVLVSFNDMKIILALFEGLTAIDETTSEAIHAAAARWDISPDNLTWTFHLHPNLTWSDGTPLTAPDFVFSLRRALAPFLAAEYAYVLYPIAGAEAYHSGDSTSFDTVGVKAPDDLTLVVTLERPNAALAAILALPVAFPVPAHVITAGGRRFDNRINPWTRPGALVGNGPYTLTTWEPNQRIVVTRNPRYRADATTTLNSVVFYPYESAAAQESAFRAGQLHLTSSVPLSRLAAYRATNSALLRVDPFLETGFLRFNTTRPPFNDPRVRRAFSLAINRTAIATQVLPSGQLPAPRFTPPDTAGYTAFTVIPHDLAAARSLLAEAGFPDGVGFPPVELMTFTREVNQLTSEALQQMWTRDLGIRVTLAMKEQRVWLDDERQLNYALSLGRWIGDYVDPGTFLDLFLSNSGNNATGWADPAYDLLITAASSEPELAARHALYDQAETLLLAAAPIAPIYHGTQAYLIAPSVRGWQESLLGFHRYHFLKLTQ